MTAPPPNPADPIRGDRRLRGSRHEREELVALAVARAQEGDRSALQFLYIRYAEEVYRYVNSIAWLRRVAHNAALENLRSKRTVPVHELPIREQSREELRSDGLRDLSRRSKVCPTSNWRSSSCGT
jgi:hypothetical protein